jgi:hypothetical protein
MRTLYLLCFVFVRLDLGLDTNLAGKMRKIVALLRRSALRMALPLVGTKFAATNGSTARSPRPHEVPPARRQGARPAKTSLGCLGSWR